MTNETDIELATRLAIQAGNLLQEFKQNNPIPESPTQRKEYGKKADRIAHNFLITEFDKGGYFGSP